MNPPAFFRTAFLFVLAILVLAPASSFAQSRKARGVEEPKKQEETTLATCDAPMGTLAVVEPQDEMIEALRRFDLESPTSLIRMMVQQSNCFQVVERGAAMRNIMQERELAASGELQQDENIGKGQLKAADYVMTPEVIFSEGNAGGVGGAVGGLLGRRNRALGALAGGLKFKEAQTSLLVADTRTGIQVAAAEGMAKKKDFSLGMLGFVGGGALAAGGYTNTNEGKVIAASFLDNYNNLVESLKSNPDLVADAGGARENVQAGAVFSMGDMLQPKLDNVEILAEPSDGTAVVGKVMRDDPVVYMGQEENGYVYVQGNDGVKGWVNKVLMLKQ